jgi:hypothetical protein
LADFADKKKVKINVKTAKLLNAQKKNTMTTFKSTEKYNWDEIQNLCQYFKKTRASVSQIKRD